jgi:excinuclease UvrABC ATPase subunit
VDFGTLKDALENYDETKAPAAFAELQCLLMQWNWQTRTKHDKEMTVTLIAALAAASFIQSTFKFRPLVCITGVSNSGKSDFQEDLLGVLFGQLSKIRQ